jgi:alkaline phosphatase D
MLFARIISLLLLGSSSTLAFAQTGQLKSGPMLGYRAHREVAVWVETTGAREVALVFHPAGQPEARRSLRQQPTTSLADTQPFTFILPLLEMGQSYTYHVEIDGHAATPALGFQTTSQWEWRSPAPDFSFLLGSCAYFNDPPYDRPGEPYGKGTEIFRHMGRTGADFMLWGGDNTYLREADFSSRSGIWYRYSHDRAHPDVQELLRTMHHYAIWDDHDYGPNDSNRTFEFKDVALQAFRAYWPNPSAGTPEHPGIYTKFVWGDAAFFLLDNRYHRDETTLRQDLMPNKTVWGREQLEWLKQSLLHTKRLRLYPFKFIVTGGQFLQSADTTQRTESHEHFRAEREELINFIRDQDITGVVFLTGDVHHSGLYRQEITPGRFLYEVTSSPLTSGSFNVAATVKANDPALIPGTLVGTQNYCQLYVRGPKDARELLVRCLDATNTLQWEHIIPLSALSTTP